MSEILERQMDRYLRGELTPAETRELAQAALSDSELFDALAAHGAVEQSLKSPEFRAAVNSTGAVKTFPRKAWGLGLAAAAAAIAAFVLYTSSRTHQQPALNNASRPTAAAKPTFIAKDFSSNPDRPVFRSADPGTRAPRPEGLVIAQDNFEVNIDLGSLDGLTKGAPLDVLRGASKQPVARLEATTVFRDRARARIVTGTPHEHDRVRIEPSAYVNAVLEGMDTNRGLGHQALSWAMDNGVSLEAIRPLLDRLAALDYQANDLAAAEKDSQLILANSPTPADRAVALNNLGAIAELRGQTSTAQASYQEALQALAEASAPPTHDRQIIQANLARLAGGGREKH